MKKMILCGLFALVVACVPTPSATPTKPAATQPQPTHPPASPIGAILSPSPMVSPTTTIAPSPTFTSTPLSDFFHIRLEWTSTSDWSTLEQLDVEHLLTVRRVSVEGEPTFYKISLERLELNQSLEEAEAGQSVGLSVDYLFSASAVNQGLSFRLQKGDIGTSVVRLYLITEEEPRLIQEFSHTGVVPGSGGLNPVTFTADLSQVEFYKPQYGEVNRIAPQKMLLAFFYMWYTLRSWESPWLQDTPLVAYDSGAHETIRQQIAQAQSAGIDGFISSWWGPGSDTDRYLPRLLELAAEQDFKVCIIFETLAGENGAPLKDKDIEEWLEYFLTRYGQNEAMLRVDGKPVVVVWASGSVPLESWAAIFSSLRARGLEAVYIGMGYDLSNLEVFDGLHEYAVFPIPNLAQTARTTGQAVHFYPLLAETSSPKIWAATVQPGYDDTLLPDREGQVQERLNGDYYRFTWEAAIASDPDWIFITSWNEWWEHTHIEPSQLYHDLYLQITLQYANLWKGGQP